MGDVLRLGWEVIITMPSYAGQYRTIVDADNGEILYCRQLMKFVAAQGNVYRVDGRTQRQMTDFPRPRQDYGLPPPVNSLPSGFPDPWVTGDNTAGNSVNAHLGPSGPVLRGTQRNGVVVFDPADPTGDDQKVLNIFYFNCFMHDYFYQLGFREADGNFQRDNFGRSGRPLRTSAGNRQHVNTRRWQVPDHEHGIGDEHQPAHGLRLERGVSRVHPWRDQSTGRWTAQ